MKKIIFTTIMFTFLLMVNGYGAPFSDISPNHWAYKAVMKLVKNNLIDESKEFHGNKVMTRYDLAKLIARLMKIEKCKKNKNFDKLILEFSEELSLLGVKLSSLEENVKKIKLSSKEIEEKIKEKDINYRVTMESRIRLEKDNYEVNSGISTKKINIDDGFIRTRFNIEADIDKNISSYFTFQDDSKFSSIKQNNNTPTPKSTIHNIYLAYIDINKLNNWDNKLRIGRQTIKLGYGLILDDEMDGILYYQKNRGIEYSLGGFKIDSLINKKSIVGSGSNDGLNFKFMTMRKDWEKISVGAYYGEIDQGERKSTTTISGEGNLDYWGVNLDGKIGEKLYSFFEYSSRKMENYNDFSNGDPLGVGRNSGEDGAAYKTGVEWIINPKYNLSLIYQRRGKDFQVLHHNDDYSESLFYGDKSFTNGGITPSVIGGATTYRDNYNNSKIFSVILGMNLMDKLNLDLWYESLTGDKEIGKIGSGITNNYDQDMLQAIFTYEYRMNTFFKLRYRRVNFDKNDSDYKAGLLSGTNPADYNQLRIDMIVKF